MDNSRAVGSVSTNAAISHGPMKLRMTPLHFKSEVLGDESKTPSGMFYRYQLFDDRICLKVNDMLVPTQ